MRKSRKLAALLATTTLITALSGCLPSEDTSTDTSTTTDATASDKTVLRVQWVGNYNMEDTTDPVTGEKQKGIGEIEVEFEKQNPDIDLQYIIMGWDDYQKKTQTMIEANEADVFQAPGIAALAEQDLLEPLQPYIDESGLDLGIYFDGSVEGWAAQGSNDTEPTIYGLPMFGDSRVILYDKQLFDDYGVEYLSAEPTVDEILEKAAMFEGPNPRTGEVTYGITFKSADAADTVMNINEGLGGKWGTGFKNAELKTEFNTPTMVEALETVQTLLTYAPDGTMNKAGGELFGTADNDVAINLRGDYLHLKTIDSLDLVERYGASRLFINEEYGMGGLFVGSPVVMSKNTEVKDAAWTYIEFTTSEYFTNYIWENLRGIAGTPTTKSILEHPDLQENHLYATFVESINYLWAPRYPYRASFGRSALTSAVEDVLINNVEIQPRLDALQTEMEEWVAQQ